MRVLHLIAPGPIAGAERVVLGGVPALAAAGVEVVLGVMGDARAPQDAERFVAALGDAVPVRRLDTRGRLDVRALAALRRAVEGQDWVHAHGYKALSYAVAARGRRRLAATHHGDTSHSRRVRLYETLQARLYRSADLVFAVSGDVQTHLLGLGLAPGRVPLVANPLTLPLSGPTPPPPRAEPLRLLALGRLAPEKGLDVLLRALTDVSAPVTLHLVGDGPERARLETNAWGLDVHFHGFADDVLPLLRACDALVMPSRREGLPMSLIEAVAADRPVVGSAVGGIPELVGDNGILVPPDDPPALRRAIERLAAELPCFQAAAALAGVRIRERHGVDAWAAATLREYRRAG